MTPISPAKFCKAVSGQRVVEAQLHTAGNEITAITLLMDGAPPVVISNGGGPLLAELTPTTGSRMKASGPRAIGRLAGRTIITVECVRPSGDVQLVALWLDDNRAVTVRPDRSRGAHGIGFREATT